MNKLRDKFSKARTDTQFDSGVKFEEQCEQITDDFSVKFAEWLQENRWFSFTNGKWNYTFEQGTVISKANYEKNYRKTTTELHNTLKKIFMEKNKELEFNNLFVGQKVIDEDGDKGEITKIENIFNIYVKYDNGGSGISCLNRCCNDKLYEL